jgi:hypothetical protein
VRDLIDALSILFGLGRTNCGIGAFLNPSKILEGLVMPRSRVGLMGMAALLGGLICAPAFGAPIGQSLALHATGDAQNPIQEVQWYWNPYDYCWHDYGWFFGLIKSPPVCVLGERRRARIRGPSRSEPAPEAPSPQ